MFKKAMSLVIAIAVIAACDGDEADSSGGVLEQVVSPTGSTAGFGDFTAGADKTFGIFVCAREGPVELESIEPIKIEGNIEFLGAMVYTATDDFVGAADGYPTTDIDGANSEPLEGATVDLDCAEPEGAEQVQLLVGAERTTEGGGSISGLLVETSSGPAEIDFTILLCGDELEYCDVLQPQDG